MAMIKTKSQLSSVDFAKEIEEMVISSGESHLNCILEYIDRGKIELVLAQKLINQNRTLKAKIKTNAEKLRLIDE